MNMAGSAPESSLSRDLVRGFLIGWAIVLLVLALGFVRQASWAVVLWPWPDGRLSYLFVASILAASALPILWIGLSGELAALRAGALDLALSCTGIAGFLLWFQAPAAGAWPTPHAPGAAVAAALNLILYGLSRGIPLRDRRPLPAPLRWSFLGFAVILVAVAAALLGGAPHVFPWPLKPETAVLIAWIFLGAAVYFLYGFRFPYRGYACGPLLGFLAYDLVLLWPFLNHFAAVRAEHLPSLIVYIAVLVYSLLLAGYYLFFHPETRLRWAMPG